MCLSDLCRSTESRVLPRTARRPVNDGQNDDDDNSAADELPRLVTMPNVRAANARTASMRRPRTAEAPGQGAEPSASTQPHQASESSVTAVDTSDDRLSCLMDISDEDRRLDEQAYEEDRRLDEETALKQQYQTSARSYEPGQPEDAGTQGSQLTSAVVAQAPESVVRDFALTAPASDNDQQNPDARRIGGNLPYRPKPAARMQTITASPVMPAGNSVDYISDWSGITISRGNAAGRRSDVQSTARHSGTRLTWDIGGEDD